LGKKRPRVKKRGARARNYIANVREKTMRGGEGALIKSRPARRLGGGVREGRKCLGDHVFVQ